RSPDRPGARRAIYVGSLPSLMRSGRFPTEAEALDVGNAVSDFIGVQLERPDAENRRRGRR
ncbi:MAG: hypothetical protein OXG42_08230, partial [Chloroflexi bacterium]|nr:hypothetical protein [Chloroflexota bacterium]